MYDIQNPKYNQNGTIDVIWNHPKYGTIPFTAVDTTKEEWSDEPEYMKEIWEGLMNGDFGAIGPYVEEPEPESD